MAKRQVQASVQVSVFSRYIQGLLIIGKFGADVEAGEVYVTGERKSEVNCWMTKDHLGPRMRKILKNVLGSGRSLFGTLNLFGLYI